MAEHSFFNSVGSRVISSLCKREVTKDARQKRRTSRPSGRGASAPPPHPAEVLEGPREDDSGEMLDDDLCGETPHLLGPLDFGEAADQLLGATEHERLDDIRRNYPSAALLTTLGGREELTMVSATAVRQAAWSSGDKREKFLSHQVFT
ncbi:hypothetical protein EYF80_016966 [Liparis tanakae]|uniref:Uncharacterized protein n=1 Tax=Liparis tanakae TaxID=230148 RepID=A0A4Z2I5V8_9TELE|nr:hypothetical protein EYF80_016966 [Liparis tanakae]